MSGHMRGRARGIYRREFLVLTGSAAAAAALAACTPTATGPAATAATAAATAAPKRGGTLLWGQTQDNTQLDPALINGGAAFETVGNLTDSLVSMDADLKLHPWLATKWTVEDNNRKYTFTLRDDVKFHDGTPFDSAAVKKTYDRIVDPRTKAAQAAGLLGTYDRSETPDARTIVMYFKNPEPLILLSIWRQFFGIISPKQLDALKPGEVITTAPVGTGPFKWMSRTADGVNIMERNPDYKWGPEFRSNRGAAYVDGMRGRRIPDPSTKTATLESGESLLIDDLQEADYPRLKNDKRFGFVQVAQKGPAYGFQFNMRKPSSPVTELAVRQALNWAVDRQGIVDKILFGVHHPLVGPLSEGVWGRLDELEKTYPLAGDKKKAGEILDAAGWKAATPGAIREKNGQKLSLILATRQEQVPQKDLATAMPLQFREIGVDIQVQSMPQNNWLDFTRAYKHDLCDAPGSNFDPDELRQRFHTNGIGAVNYAGLSDPVLDDLFVKGQNAPLGSDQRRQVYADIQKRFMDLAVLLPLITLIRTEAFASRAHGLAMEPTGLVPLPHLDLWLDS
jgi:peptide/nickel transport system substrate-binding protein